VCQITAAADLLADNLGGGNKIGFAPTQRGATAVGGGGVAESCVPLGCGVSARWRGSAGVIKHRNALGNKGLRSYLT
jgi:hypothetical protein